MRWSASCRRSPTAIFSGERARTGACSLLITAPSLAGSPHAGGSGERREPRATVRPKRRMSFASQDDDDHQSTQNGTVWIKLPLGSQASR